MGTPNAPCASADVEIAAHVITLIKSLRNIGYFSPVDIEHVSVDHDHGSGVFAQH
jgi:hypothetical protein